MNKYLLRATSYLIGWLVFIALCAFLIAYSADAQTLTDKTIKIDAVGHSGAANSSNSLSCPAGGILYVNANSTNSPDGTNWATAFPTLQDALAVTDACEIWVAAGVYYPDEGAGQTDDDRDSTFQLKPNVDIYGGFAGTETARDQRDWEANVTVLSGDLDQNDTTDANSIVADADNITGNNSYHVVTGNGNAALDGVTITAGLANGSSSSNQHNGGGMYNTTQTPTVNRIVFSGNYAINLGGGIYNHDGSLTISDTTFTGNAARDGGGMYNYNFNAGSVTVSNTTFVGNRASSTGGGIRTYYGNLTMSHVTISGNTSNYGGGIFTASGNLSISYTTIFGNSGNNGGGMYSAQGNPAIIHAIMWDNGISIDNESTSNPTIEYSLVEGSGGSSAWDSAFGTDGGNNLDVDPLLGSLADNGGETQTHALLANSPAIDAGETDCSQTDDQRGVSRPQGNACDMGAYEAESTAPSNTAPEATNDSEMTLVNDARTVYAPGVLVNDSDADGDDLIVTANTQPSNGTATVNADGSYTYTPINGYAGIDSFEYTVSDGTDTDTATVTIRVLVDSSADVQVPLDATGWNLFAYPIQQTRTLTDALSSIDGEYTSVFEYIAGDNNDPWRSHNANLPADFQFLNDLTELNFAHGYWIYATNPTTITFAGLTRGATQTMRSTNTLNATPPAMVYGYLDAAQFAAGMPIEANINGTTCGQAVTHEVNGRVLYGIEVAASDMIAGCGSADSTVTISINNTEVATTSWQNNAPTDTSLVPTSVGLQSSVTESTTIWRTIALLTGALGLAVLTIKRRNLLTLVLALALMGAAVQPAMAQTPDLPHTFYGSLTVDEAPAADGLEIVAVVTNSDDDSETFTFRATPASVTNNGNYGIEIPADDPTTELYDGGTDNDAIAFFVEIDGSLVEAEQTAVFGSESDRFTQLNLTAETNQPPVANDDSATTDEDNSVLIDVLDNDTDPDNDELTIVDEGSPSHGTTVIESGQIRYTPAANYNGSDSFTYVISDSVETATATVSVTITPVNDPPTTVDLNQTFGEDGSVTIPVITNSSDIDGDNLVISNVTTPTHGTATVVGDSVQYVPNADYNGLDSLTYTVSDGNGGTATGTSNLTIIPVDDDPRAADDSATTDEDVSVSIDVLSNDEEVDGETLTLVSTSGAALGTADVHTVTQTILYTPAENLHGSDTFTYVVRDDNGNTDTATVTVTITPVNDAPTTSDRNENVDEDQVLTVDVLATSDDVDGDSPTISAVGSATNGTTVIVSDTINYTPAADYNGDDSFTFTISDGNGGTATGTVNVTVNPVNDAPTTSDRNENVDEDQVLTVDVLATSDDVDGDSLTISAVGSATNGTTAIVSDTISYTPAADYNGGDSFTFTISDGNGGTATGTVNVTVNPVNDAPIAANDSDIAIMNEARVINAPGVLANDSDIDSEVLTAAVVSQGSKGTVIINSDGGFTYTPDTNAVGSDSFTYAVSDGELSAEATVSILIVADSTTVEIPFEEGWNLFGYPIWGSSPVADALSSIDGKYDLVYGYDGGWRMYSPILDPSFNDLAELAFGQAYWILTNEATTVRFGSGRSTQTVDGSGAMPPAPMLVYGVIEDGRADVAVAAVIDGVVCGAATTMINATGEIVYRVFIEAASVSHPNCGQPGATVELFYNGQLIEQSTWDSAPTEQPLDAVEPTHVGLSANNVTNRAATWLLLALVGTLVIATRSTVRRD